VSERNKKSLGAGLRDSFEFLYACLADPDHDIELNHVTE